MYNNGGEGVEFIIYFPSKNDDLQCSTSPHSLSLLQLVVDGRQKFCFQSNRVEIQFGVEIVADQLIERTIPLAISFIISVFFISVLFSWLIAMGLGMNLVSLLAFVILLVPQ